jgi:hypothetical protein
VIKVFVFLLSSDQLSLSSFDFSLLLCDKDVTQSNVQGAILISGIYDLNNAISENEALNWRECLFRKAYIIPTFGLNQQLWLDASPHNHVSTHSLPPFLLINASQ